MKSFVKIALVLGLFISIYSCQPDDSSSVTPPRAYDEVYNEEIAKIEEFLETHYVTVDGDFNTTFTKIPDGGTQTPVADMPQLDFKEVDLHDITYKIYYLKLREGLGQSPTRVDSTFVGYKGDRLFKDVVDNVPTYTINPFENNPNPIWFTLDRVIRGWAEIIPEFKTGTFGSNPDGTVSYQDFGAGVMFLPSGVAYFNTVRPGIPSYSILMFNFKLYNLQYMDHDRDRILSKDEYGDPTNPNRFKLDAIDTDGDGRADYLDTDDDGDGVLTRTEISFTYDEGGVTKTGYYPYHGAAVDDPSTPYDDTYGIPRKYTGPLNSNNRPTPLPVDFTDVNRLRRHLDNTTKPPFE